jgi:hypothetical protein
VSFFSSSCTLPTSDTVLSPPYISTFSPRIVSTGRELHTSSRTHDDTIISTPPSRVRASHPLKPPPNSQPTRAKLAPIPHRSLPSAASPQATCIKGGCRPQLDRSANHAAASFRHFFAFVIAARRIKPSRAVANHDPDLVRIKPPFNVSTPAARAHARLASQPQIDPSTPPGPDVPRTPAPRGEQAASGGRPKEPFASALARVASGPGLTCANQNGRVSAYAPPASPASRSRPAMLFVLLHVLIDTWRSRLARCCRLTICLGFLSRALSHQRRPPNQIEKGCGSPDPDARENRIVLAAPRPLEVAALVGSRKRARPPTGRPTQLPKTGLHATPNLVVKESTKKVAEVWVVAAPAIQPSDALIFFRPVRSQHATHHLVRPTPSQPVVRGRRRACRP